MLFHQVSFALLENVQNANEKATKQQVLLWIEEISSKIDIQKVLGYLLSKTKLISNVAVEIINQKSTPLEQCKYIVLFLYKNSSQTPYLDFREALVACGYTDVMQMIDDKVPNVYESLTPSKNK